jgi:hypothetical protein
MTSKQDYTIEKTPISSDGFDRISLEKTGNPDTKAGVTATTTALLDGDEPQHADESGIRKADRNLKAAIWTIVCGVALPCVPVIIISAVLIYMVLGSEAPYMTGLPELEPPKNHTKRHGAIECLSWFRHNAGPAYYVMQNPSTITTVASWTSRVIPYLTSSIMALVAFFAARRIVTKSTKGSGDDLPTPEQLTLLIDLLGGKGLEPLKDTLLHRWVHKRKLVDPIPLAFGALFSITLLG